MRITQFFLIPLLLLLAWAPRAKAVQSPSQSELWAPGHYTGWVYFLARSDAETNISAGNVHTTSTTVLYHESHGTINCTVFDEAGNGVCSADFPLDMIGTVHGTAQTPDCSVIFKEDLRAVGISIPNPIVPLNRFPLANGFSLGFSPNAGPFIGRLEVTASGGIPGCESKVLSGEIPRGIRWSDLDFHIEFHDILTAGGTCSMADFPRELQVGNTYTSAVIEDCRWRMFHFDPYAEFPEE